MTNKHGEWLWYELMTPDADAARTFYEAVAGWTIGTKSDQPGMDYRMIDAADGPVAGLLQLDDHMLASGAKPLWIGYVAVDDVDASVQQVTAAGGQIHVPPRDLEGVGRFAMVADPQGTPFYVMRGTVEGGTSTSFAPETPGHCAWNELHTTDQAGAHAFYGKLFGWTQQGNMPMGEMGDYCFLFLGEERFGATMRVPGQPHWLPYFNVTSINASVDAVKAKGGTIINGPHEVPGGGHIIIGIDPQGAQFALVGAL